MNNDIFRHADKSLMVMLNDMSREFQRISTQLGFDELNVLDAQKTVSAMYSRMDSVIRREYRRIALAAYRDGGGRPDDFDMFEFVVTMLEAYDPLSGFVYDREWKRKQDRLFESIIATQRGNQEMRKALKRGLDVLANQVRQYADNITVGARLKAFENRGVKYVRWVAEKDDRTCEECMDRDGKVYKIEDFPVCPAHWHCRCRPEPATKEDYMKQQAA